jgi:hypothetical protein
VRSKKPGARSQNSGSTLQWAILTPVFCLLTPLLSAQTYHPPRTPDGQPDLQGVWTNVTITPMERPAEFAGKAFMTKEEAAAYEKRVLANNNADRRDGGAEADVGRAYNDAWYDRGTKTVATLRTSLIVDPPDGRIPPLTPERQKQMSEIQQAAIGHSTDGPENRLLQERCILWPTAGPPMLPSFYNNNYQIVQAPGYIVILVEMVHDARIIPLDNRPHLPAGVHEWMGDSRGHWEGNTLVVETTNFNDRTRFRGADENLRLVERFTRVDPETINYEFTVNDPTAFTKPWTAQIPMKRAEGPIFEYACHEGNYAMTDMLAGARAEERAKAEKAVK